MTSFAHQCGVHDAARQMALERTARLIEASGVALVRFAWCDLHGMLRCKTLVAGAAVHAMMNGVGMVSTLLLKDSADRTAYPVFDAGSDANLPGFQSAGNLMLLADPTSYRQLPWAHNTGWVQCQAWSPDHQPVALDTRRILQAALAKLAKAGYGLQCGLEIEFHIYKINANLSAHHLDPMRTDWPGPAPDVSLIHPGYSLLSEQWTDMSEEALHVVQHTAQALGLPLLSLEIEFGPSQVEAVFEATDALTAADNMVLFRSAVKQALHRAGYHATFMCRPPFAHILSSGWHLHQSLTDIHTGANAFTRDVPLADSNALQAAHTLSTTGACYLAGLLAHAGSMTALCTPTINGYDRFQANALAPQSAVWGRDNRGAMLRVIGGPGDKNTRIENRVGEPAANPYLYMASQIHAGLGGLEHQLTAPLATTSPYESAHLKLPTSLRQALDTLGQDTAFAHAMGTDFVGCFTRIKRQEIERYNAADDKTEWQRREYFGRI